MDIGLVDLFNERYIDEKNAKKIVNDINKLHYYLVKFFLDVKMLDSGTNEQIDKVYDEALEIDNCFFTHASDAKLGPNTCQYLNDIHVNLAYYCGDKRKFCAYVRTRIFKPDYLAIITPEYYAFKKAIMFITPYQNDFERIVSCPSTRRLQDKAQVFSLEAFDFVRTRLTHSNEVSAVAEQLLQKMFYDQSLTALNTNAYKMSKLEDLATICRCASLLHDIGNPPFGHYGESIIRTFYKKVFYPEKFKISESVSKRIGANSLNVDNIITDPQMINDFTKFDGNAQAFRVINTLQPYRDKKSLNLTASVIRSIIKYPCKSSPSIEDGKFGYFYSEKDFISFLENKAGYQDGYVYLPALIMEVSDDICYNISDFEDSYKKGLITYEHISNLDTSHESKEVQDFFKKFEKYYKLNKGLYDDPLEVTLNSLSRALKNDLVCEAAYVLFDQSKLNMCLDRTKKNSHVLDYVPSYSICRFIKDKLIKPNVYKSRLISQCELEADTILSYLLTEFTNAVLLVDFEAGKNQNFKSEELLNIEKYKKIINLISKHIIDRYKEKANAKQTTPAEKLYYRLKIVVDYISGMTDSFAKYVFKTLTGQQ